MDIEKQVLRLSDITKFNPMQKAALKMDWRNKSLVVSAPTASGKTLLAELAALNSIINKKRKVIYTCPLRALATEHWSEFKRRYSKPLGIRAALSTGDLDSSSKYLQNYDTIFTTYEKLDSLLRHRADWLASIGLLVIDEVHSLGSDRGPTIEMAVTKLRQLNPELQVLALSATIPNCREIAEWLNAELVESDYRPIPLREGVFFNAEAKYKKGKKELFDSKEPLKAIAKDTIFGKRKQVLVFANTRKRAGAIAGQLAPFVEKNLSEKEKNALKKESQSILNALEQPTEQCRKLAEIVSKGVAFHHAGLVSKQRTIVEDAFKSNCLKMISATPTLCVVPETRLWNGVEESRVGSFSFNQRLLALKENKLISIKPKTIVKRVNDKKIVNIKSLSGFSVKLTANHRVLLKRNGKKHLVAAADCKKGDKIATVGILPKTLSHKFVIGKSTIPFSGSNLPMTKDLFYFVGSMLGDGYSGVEGKSDSLRFKGSPCLVGIDKEIFQSAKKVCDFYSVPYRETKNFYGTPSLIFSKKKWFRVFLANSGVQKGAEKFIAKKLMLAPDSSIRSLLQGLFDTDGFVNSGLSVGFSNISISLIKDLQRLLLLFGVVSNLRERKESVMKLHNKSYRTKKHFELTITQRKSVLNFHKKIGFRVKRKRESLKELIESINSNIHYLFCNNCKYKLFHDLFSGRNKQHTKWGKRKLLIIKMLGEEGKLTSFELSKRLGFLPYKGERRLDHHFELIKRTRIGNSKLWELNDIGIYVYTQIFRYSNEFKELFDLKSCPICGKKLTAKLRGCWRKKDFEGDIFWDFVSKVSKESKQKHPFVFDVVLPSNNSNDHLFVAEGFLVHNSAGINLPSHTVIIPSLYRYTAAGMTRIPISEYKQMAGRASRPKYDREGRSLVLARSESERDELMEEYINGQIEPAESKLGFEPVLRMHMLSLIASNFVFDLASMEQFFKKTFYAKQFGEMQVLFEKLQGVLLQLQEMGFIEADEKRIKATPLGTRVSELYLDPLSAFEMINALKKPVRFSPFSYLFLLSNCSELMPWLSVPKAKEAGLWEQLQLRKKEMPVNIDKEMFFDLNLLRKFNTALMLEQWIEESGEQAIMLEFKTQPGILHAKLSICNWLCYASLQLARLLEMESHYSPLSKLRKRLKHGIREELIFLTEVKHIGRVRARGLWRNNIRTIAQLKKIDEADLARILGRAVAQKVKTALG